MQSLKHYIRLIEAADQTSWTYPMIADLKRQYDQGVSYHDMAKALNVSLKSLGTSLDRHYPNRIRRHQEWPADMVTQLKQLHNQGWTTRQIADHFGKSINAIDQALNQYYQDRQKKHSGPRGLSLTDAKQMLDQWLLGRSTDSISSDYSVSRTAVLHWIKRFCELKGLDYLTLRQQHLKNRAVHAAQPAQKTIVRPGTMDNLKSKGPGSRHRAGYRGKQY